MTPVASKTVMDPAQARAVLLDAATSVMGRPPTADELAMLMAVSAVETNHWRSMYDFNFGNLRPGSRKPTPYWQGQGALNPANRQEYRSYPDPVSGAADMIHLLTRVRSDWRNGLLSGDPATFAAALGNAPSYHGVNGEPYPHLPSLARRYGGSRDVSIAPSTGFGAAEMVGSGLLLAALLAFKKG